MSSPRLKHNFIQSVRWNFAGSLFTEGLKVLHQLALFWVIGHQKYGLAGYLFSWIFLVVNVSDAGLVYAIPPFSRMLFSSRYALKKYFLPLLCTQIIILSLAAMAMGWYLTTHAPISPLLAIIAGSLILTEGLRVVLRLTVHALFLTPLAVMGELFLLLCYLVIVWGPYFFMAQSPTLITLFVPYALTSWAALLFFSILIYRYTHAYLQDPAHAVQIDKNIWRQLLSTRLIGYGVQASKNIFTGNFLVAMCAPLVGFESIAVIKVAHYLAEALRAVIKAVIGFSGMALLSTLKQQPPSIKRRAFSIVMRQFLYLFVPVIVLLLTNISTLYALTASHHVRTMALHAATLLFGLALLDHPFYLYEQWYIVEERVHTILFLRLFEGAAWFLLAKNIAKTNLLMLVASMLIVRVLSLASLMGHAYFIFGIRPRWQIPWWYVAAWIAVGGIVAWGQRLIAWW